MNLQAGYPFSLIKHGLPFQYPKLSSSIKTDVAIIGGGISGALAAYHLTNAGFECVVVDGRTIGLGSTCASTSLLQYEIDVSLTELIKKRGEQHAVRAYQLCKESIEKLGSIASKLNFKEFEFKHSLYFEAYKKDTNFLKEEFLLRKKYGFKVDYLESQAIDKEFDFSSPSAILSQHGGQANAYAFTHALYQYSLKNGLKVYDRTFVTHIDHQKNGIVLKTKEGFTVNVKKVIYATGYEVTEFIKKKIVSLHTTYATVSENVDPTHLSQINKTLFWNTANPYLYLRTTYDDRIIMGGRDEEFYNATKRDKLIGSKSKQLVNDFQKLFPHIPFKSEFNWAGTFGSTIDGLPFIGAYSKLKNGYFSLGFGGNGITFSLIGAEILTDALLKKKNKDAEIFSFNRI